MTTHTPGPWVYPGKANQIESAQGAPVLDLGCGCCSCHSTTEEDFALIAAAPELLAACMEVAQGYTTRGSEMARAAIAKATGSAE